MPQAEHANTPSPSRRRTLFAAAGAVITAGVAEPAPQVKMTPITAAGRRLAHLSAINQENLTADAAHALCVEQCDLAALIMDSAPQTVVDAVVLLMVAAGEILGDDMHENGTFAHERGDIMVRRVMVFLAGQAGVSLSDYGGTYFLSADEHEALAHEGTVVDAAASFNGVDLALAQERRQDQADLFRIHHLRSLNTPEMLRGIADRVAKASKKWANISDDDPRFDGGRALLARMRMASSGEA